MTRHTSTQVREATTTAAVTASRQGPSTRRTAAAATVQAAASGEQLTSEAAESGQAHLTWVSRLARTAAHMRDSCEACSRSTGSSRAALI